MPEGPAFVGAVGNCTGFRKRSQITDQVCASQGITSFWYLQDSFGVGPRICRGLRKSIYRFRYDGSGLPPPAAVAVRSEMEDEDVGVQLRIGFRPCACGSDQAWASNRCGEQAEHAADPDRDSSGSPGHAAGSVGDRVMQPNADRETPGGWIGQASARARIDVIAREHVSA